VRICIVAFVVPQHGIGGMQDHTRDLGQGLVRAGHEVCVITSRHPEGKRDESLRGVHYVFVDAPMFSTTQPGSTSRTPSSFGRSGEPPTRAGPIFVVVGRLSPDKGFHHALQALALLDGAASSPRLAIVGDGEERERLEMLARELGIDLRVIFAGAQPHETVAIAAAADSFLFPTQRDEPRASSSFR
jgi:hypothetical protein